MRRAPLGAALAVVVALVAATTVVGHAAVLPLQAQTLLGQTFTNTPTGIPAPLVRDTFTTSGSLAARSADTGQFWMEHSGTWTTRAGYVRSTATPRSVATIDAGETDVAVQATFRFGSRAGAAGLVVARTATWYGSRALHVEYSNGVVRLIDLGTFFGWPYANQLAEVAVAPPVVGAPVRLTVVRTGQAVVVAFDGVVVLEYQLPANVSSALTGTRHGLVTLNDSATTIDDFEVYS